MRREHIAGILENVECGKQLLDLIMRVGLDSCPLRETTGKCVFHTKGQCGDSHMKHHCKYFKHINAAIKGESNG